MIRWSGSVVRVDSDDSSDESKEMWVNQFVEQRHKTSTVEVLVSMPHSSKEYDLVLTFDLDHLSKNLGEIDKLTLDTFIQFTGYIHHLGRQADSFKIDELYVPNVVVFDLDIL